MWPRGCSRNATNAPSEKELEYKKAKAESNMLRALLASAMERESEARKAWEEEK